MEYIKDVVIIGGGVAGSTVAIYLARAGYKPLILTNGEIGGKLNEIETIQNYVGIPNAEGSLVAEGIEQQLISSNLEFGSDILLYVEVTKLTKDENSIWNITYSDLSGEIYNVSSKNVVIATGMINKKLPQLEDSIQHSCVLCDGFSFEGERVLVIGGGSSALTEAIELSKICKDVFILRRSEKFKAEDILIERTIKAENIHHVVGQILEFDGKSVTYLTEDGNHDEVCDISGIFTYIGSTPNSDILPTGYAQDPLGHIYDVDNRTYSNSDNEIDYSLYVCGDVTTTTAKQFGIAIGQATIVATELIKKLS